MRAIILAAAVKTVETVETAAAVVTEAVIIVTAAILKHRRESKRPNGAR